jgi:hypothetical protein
MPGQRYTTIKWRKGERWFCTEQEAVRAGWRRAIRLGRERRPDGGVVPFGPGT